MLKSFIVLNKIITFAMLMIKFISKILLLLIVAVYVFMSTGIGFEHHTCEHCAEDVCDILHEGDCCHDVCDLTNPEHKKEHKDCDCSYEFFKITDDYTVDFHSISAPVFSVIYTLFSSNNFDTKEINFNPFNFAIPLRNYKTPQIIHFCTLLV